MEPAPEQALLVVGGGFQQVDGLCIVRPDEKRVFGAGAWHALTLLAGTIDVLRVVAQRVRRASVSVGAGLVGEIGAGLLLPVHPHLSSAEQDRTLDAIFDYAIG